MQVPILVSPILGIVVASSLSSCKVTTVFSSRPASKNGFVDWPKRTNSFITPNSTRLCRNEAALCFQGYSKNQIEEWWWNNGGLNFCSCNFIECPWLQCECISFSSRVLDCLPGWILMSPPDGALGSWASTDLSKMLLATMWTYMYKVKWRIKHLVVFLKLKIRKRTCIE